MDDNALSMSNQQTVTTCIIIFSNLNFSSQRSHQLSAIFSHHARPSATLEADLAGIGPSLWRQLSSPSSSITTILGTIGAVLRRRSKPDPGGMRFTSVVASLARRMGWQRLRVRRIANATLICSRNEKRLGGEQMAEFSPKSVREGSKEV